jgi:DHA3 family tetracycline resistance protein-like MFS transporter
VLRHRDYALLWGGQAVSGLGDGMYTVALALEALRVSDHTTTLAYVAVARVAPGALLFLIPGAVADRLPRRLVALMANALRGGAVAAIAVLGAAHALDVAELAGLSAALGAGDAFFAPAYQAIMPELLPPGLLPQGNALSIASSVVGTSFAGPAAAGVIIALAGTPAALAADAATFGVSLLCLALMRSRPAAAAPGTSMAAGIRQGIRWTMGQRWLRLGTLALAVIALAAQPQTAVTIPLLLHGILRQGPAAYGVTFAAAGAGGLAAAVVAGRLGRPRRIVTMTWAAWATASLALAGIGLAPDVLAVAACGALAYFGLVYGNLLWTLTLQTAVPASMLGRAASVEWLFSSCLSPLGLLLAGVLAGPIGVRPTILLGGGLAALSCLVVFIPGARDPERPGYQPHRLRDAPDHDRPRNSSPIAG